MDFFARQAATRRQSRWMVFLFVIAVIAIVIAIDLVVVTTVAILSVQDDGGLLATPDLSLTRFPLVSCSRPSSCWARSALQPRAHRVARAPAAARSPSRSAARRVGADTDDPLKRRLRNVVEEIAIASGVPVPQVYVLEGEAGSTRSRPATAAANAAIAVTRGTLERSTATNCRASSPTSSATC